MKISHAIFKINPVAEFSYNEENIDTIQWHNGTTPIPKEQILAIIPQVEKENNINKNRIKEYGSWQSQLDEIYHSGLDSWKARLANIKLKYPKE
jgi:uncharacterized protein involved in tellurium resistance